MKTDFMQTVNLLTIELQLRVEGSNNLLSLCLKKSLKNYIFSLKPALKSSSDVRYYAPINVKPAGGGSRAWGGDLTFFKNWQSDCLPTGKSFQSIATKFPHPGLHIAAKCPKAEPKEGTIKISPNKTLQSLFILLCCITKDTCSCYSCNHTF